MKDFFAEIAKGRLKKGMVGSLVEVLAAIERFATRSNGHPKPFSWTADLDRIIQTAQRGGER